ncbi:putative lipoprotein [Archangium gephyra]|uniref:Lipoprotein n=1 Tax=Archangium gephyra TaxID=48 RepID=A0AAC8Q8Y4_9BACT|nr:putative lipoprotein [Archangium gephyra]
MRHLLPLAALLAGCTLYPEDPLFAYGQVSRADGTPVSDATLSFERALSYRPGPYPTLIPPEFSPHATATTRAEGAYTLELLAGATVERVRTEEGYDDVRLYRFRAVSPVEEGRAAILSFTLVGGDVELPPLRPWVADLSVGEGAEGRPAVSFAPLPLRPEPPPTGTWQYSTNPKTGELIYDEGTVPHPVVQLIQGDAVLWQEEVSGSPWTVAPWLREDFEALEVMVRAQTTGDWTFEPLGGRFSAMGYRLEWRSERLPMPGAGLRPVSRGASCEPLPAGVTVCPWTDGQLASVKLPPVSTQPEKWPEVLRLTLAAPARPSRIVLRGLAADDFHNPLKKLFVEGSEDGVRWVSLGEVVRPALEGVNRAAYRDVREVEWAGDNPLDPALQVDLTSNLYLEGALRTEVAVRHVRLRGVPAESTRPIELKALREVSLFE